MISLYSGTPGSGKSLHVAQKIYDRLFWAKKNVIGNFPINRDMVFYSKQQLRKMRKNPDYKPPRRNAGIYYFVDDIYLTPEFLINYAKKFHVPRKEHQTLLVIDECSSDLLFSNRAWQNKNRQAWVRFFQVHRHLGYDIILISQSDKLIDKAIRCFIEYDVKHRKTNNFNIFFKIISLFLLGKPIFVAVTVWYSIKEKTGSEFFMFKKFYNEFYDSFYEFK